MKRGVPSRGVIAVVSCCPGPAALVRVERLLDRPIITLQLHESIGPNIQGPSLIRAGVGAGSARANYFADHKGRHRLAYADDLLGPWRSMRRGVCSRGLALLTDPPDGRPRISSGSARRCGLRIFRTISSSAR
jgi:hypothetical protein